MLDVRRPLRSVLSTLFVLGAVAVPGALFVAAPGPDLPEQVAVAPTVVPEIVVHEPLSDVPTHVPILTYHDISDRGGDHSVTPERFAEHLAALHAAGFETVSPIEIDRLLDGDAEGLPPKPIMLTFDDGPASLYTTADPLLERYGYRATAFLITGHTPASGGASYYLSWQLARSLLETDRWTFGSHTHDMHHQAPLPLGGEGPPLINRLLIDGTPETLDAWRRRVTADLDASVRAFGRNLGVVPRGFSYPFTASTAPANDQQIPRLLTELVVERFGSGYGGGADATRTAGSTSDPARIPRIGVTADMDAEGLLRELAEAAPVPPTPDLDTLRWTASDVRCEVRSTRIVLVGDGYGRCAVDGDTTPWRDYRATIEVRGADREVTALISLREGAAGRVEIGIGEARARVQQLTGSGWEVLEEVELEPAHRRRLEVDVSGPVLALRFDDDRWLRTTLDDRLVDGALGFGLASRGEGRASFAVDLTSTWAGVPTGLRPSDDREERHRRVGSTAR